VTSLVCVSNDYGPERIPFSSGIVKPNAVLKGFLNALKYPRGGVQIQCVRLSMEPVIDLRLGIIRIGGSVGYFAPIIRVAERKKFVSGRHTARYILHGVRSVNSKGGRLIIFDAVPIAIGIDRLQRASGAVLGFSKASYPVRGRRGQCGNEIAGHHR